MVKVYIYKKGDDLPSRLFDSLNEAQAYIGKQVEKALTNCPKDKRVKVDIQPRPKNNPYEDCLSLEYSNTLEKR